MKRILTALALLALAAPAFAQPYPSRTVSVICRSTPTTTPTMG